MCAAPAPETRGTDISALVAQLDRASGYEPEGREFESLRAHHFLMYFGYVLRSEATDHHYIGFTSDLAQRLSDSRTPESPAKPPRTKNSVHCFARTPGAIGRNARLALSTLTCASRYTVKCIPIYLG